MPFAQNLKIAMQVRGVSNYKLAQDLNVSQSSIANWISGDIKPHRKTRIKIAEYFGTTVEKMDGDCFSKEDVKKAPTLVSESGQPVNVVKIAGRDGSFMEKRLNDKELQALKAFVDLLPDADDL